MDKFLKKWVGPFCDKIKQGADNEFYSSLADCLSVLLKKRMPVMSLPEALKGKKPPEVKDEKLQEC